MDKLYRLLTFETDIPHSTRIFGENGEVYYTVHTTSSSQSRNITHVRNANDDILGSIEWRETLPDKTLVNLRGKRNTWWSPWLRRSILPFQNTATFKDNTGRKYTWNGIAPCEELQLWVTDCDFPIAKFRQSRPWLPGRLFL